MWRRCHTFSAWPNYKGGSKVSLISSSTTWHIHGNRYGCVIRFVTINVPFGATSMYWSCIASKHFSHRIYQMNYQWKISDTRAQQKFTMEKRELSSLELKHSRSRLLFIFSFQKLLHEGELQAVMEYFKEKTFTKI